MPMAASNKAITIIWVSLLAGTCDITSAFIINYHTSPLVIFRYIASAVFGKAAFTGGSQMIWWGVLFHYVIAIAFSVCLFMLYPHIKKLLPNKYMIALIYGIVIWLFMNFLVLPLTNVPKQHFKTYGVITGILALIICIGLVVSLAADNYYKKLQTQDL